MPSKSPDTKALERDQIALRRQRVQSLRNRGLTHLEIWSTLSREFNDDGSINRSRMINLATGEPYDRSTITYDLKWLREDNLRHAREDAAIHQARQLSEIDEIKRAAWAARDPELALKALDREMKLLGTLRQPDGLNININIQQLMIETVQTLEAAGIDPAQAFEALINKAKAKISAGG